MKLKTQRSRGMKDIFGDEAEFYLKIRELIVEFSLLYGFKYIETPIVENVKTFTLSLGATSDVVGKEMFYLKGKEKKEKYVLRPEGTAPLVRAYFENGMINLPQPVSLFYLERMYRKERPQHGRLREHRQWGLEILNSEDPFSDFFIIYVFFLFLKKIKINNFIVKLNSIGCSFCRKKYIKQLLNYYKSHKKNLCSDCQKRFKQNPLRLLDCKNALCQSYKEEAPNILDFLCKACRLHFQKVLELLDYFKVNYELDKTLVRGFDYYQRTVFEFFLEGDNLAFGGGGRYDLGEIISNLPLPSVGGALGLERLKFILEERKISFKTQKAKIFMAFAGEEARPKAFEIYQELADSGFWPAANFFKTSLSHQLEFANKIGVNYSLILGFQELAKGTIIFKDMRYGTQELLKLSSLTQELKKILKEKK